MANTKLMVGENGVHTRAVINSDFQPKAKGKETTWEGAKGSDRGAKHQT